MTTDAPDFGSLVFFALLSIVFLYIGKKRDFFCLPSQTTSLPVPIRWFHVVLVFAIYFAISNILTPWIGKIFQIFLFKTPGPSTFLQYAGWLNFINSSLILVGLIASLFLFSSRLRLRIWRFSTEEPHSYPEDIRFGILGWICSFPLVLFVNQLFDFFITHVLHIVQVPEQLAVYFLKMTFNSPFYLTLAILTIVIFAPIIEEILFRGFLQSFIRQHLGPKQAILITSILFSFFHYSPEQGIANLTIIASLFVFSLFIGFIYEKRRSLVSPMTLHAIFNLINVGNLYFLGGLPKNLY